MGAIWIVQGGGGCREVLFGGPLPARTVRPPSSAPVASCSSRHSGGKDVLRFSRSCLVRSQHLRTSTSWCTSWGTTAARRQIASSRAASSPCTAFFRVASKRQTSTTRYLILLTSWTVDCLVGHDRFVLCSGHCCAPCVWRSSRASREQCTWSWYRSREVGRAVVCLQFD